MLAPAPVDFVFSCDVCGKATRAELDVAAPAGFVRLDVHPRSGLGATLHACLGACLVTLAHRLRREHAARSVTVPR